MGKYSKFLTMFFSTPLELSVASIISFFLFFVPHTSTTGLSFWTYFNPYIKGILPFLYMRAEFFLNTLPLTFQSFIVLVVITLLQYLAMAIYSIAEQMLYSFRKWNIPFVWILVTILQVIPLAMWFADSKVLAKQRKNVETAN